MTVTNTGLPSIHRGDCVGSVATLAHPTMARFGASEHHRVAATDRPLRTALVHRHGHPRPDQIDDSGTRPLHITAVPGRIAYLGVATGTGRSTAPSGWRRPVRR